MMISNIRKNCMGTASFDGLFAGQRKVQDFIVYPMGERTDAARIQSDKRAGFINLQNGEVYLSKNQYDFGNAHFVGELPAAELKVLRNSIVATADRNAGNNGVITCDNSGADKI
jgi:hypothetical protein